jgi:hypothetical protein
MDTIGPAGRAQVIQRDMPGAALRLLCEEVEGLSFRAECSGTGNRSGGKQ